MKQRENKFKKKLKENKILVLSMIFSVLLLATVAIPTLSEYKISTPTYTINAWDGTTATSYKNGDGSKENPYVISNGSELSFFASQLAIQNTYEGKYFILSNDIILNDGIFNYNKNDGIKYTKNGIENEITPKEENNIINKFKHLNGFKGNFDGNNHSIYGLYIDESLGEQNALFTNLEGNISNLYIKNSIIYGGKITAGLASKTNNSTLTNISYSGFVVSDKEIANKVINLEIDSIEKTVTTLEYNDTINIVNLNYIPGIITQITLSGIYQTDNSKAILKINEQTITPGEFELTLDNKLQTVIPIIYQSDIESNFSLSNLKYQVNYNYSNASGIVSIAENTTLKNIINKASINGTIYASGIINTASGITTLKNIYNNGTIESNNLSSGLISNINQNKENITITNCYNNGILTSNNNAMVGNIENNTGTITITNTFNTQDNYGINLIESSNVSINNSYIITDKKIKTGNSQGEFIKTTLENLKNKDYVQKNLNYKEYVELEKNEDEVWVWQFETDSLPILYIDELNNPIANIHVKEYVWNNYKNKLETLKFSDKIVFSIEESNTLNPIKEIYYYISNEKNPLTKEQINQIDNWQIYNEIIEINEEGFYVIYAKIIDNNNNIIYLNTDLLVIDLTGSDITIKSQSIDKIWKDFKTSLDNYYIDKETTISISAEDSLSGINKIYYYMSDTILSKEEVEKIDEWNEYTEEITVNNKKTIIYVKVVDNCNYSTYANSDLIIINGYTLNKLSPGMNGQPSENLYITSTSSVSIDFSYQDDFEYNEGSKHQIISNTLLPQNTKITLIDKINSKVYVYITKETDNQYTYCNQDVCETKYDFSLFNEVGSTIKFQENNYTGIINENFTVILDFLNAKIKENIENISILLKIDNENENYIRNTLSNSNKKFNIIYENSQPNLKLTSNFKETINYSENKTYTVDFQTKLNYQKIDDNKIFDTTHEGKNIGLSIKMIDNNGNIVSKQNLKNISFVLGEKKYSPLNDGIVKINLERGIGDITDNLIIQTYTDNSTLEEGNYKFIISLYTAYDGINSNEFINDIEIPVYVGKNTYNSDNNFNVIMNNEDKIITTKENEFDFEILLSEPDEFTNIKISLYKKTSLSAYDQNYTLVDLKDYIINNKFEKYDEKIYYAIKEPTENNTLKVKLNTSLLEKKGYMFVFELYEDEKLINKINKKFIVK